jgi:hypothetical protein
MAEEQAPDEGAAKETQSPEDAWREVGRQVEALGDSLARAFQAAWQSEETQRHVRSVQKGLDRVAEDIDRAVKKAGESQQASRIRTQAERTAGSVRQAGEKTWEDMRPQVLSGLKRVDDRLRKLIQDLESEVPEGSAPQGRDTTQERSQQPDRPPEA